MTMITPDVFMRHSVLLTPIPKYPLNDLFLFSNTTITTPFIWVISIQDLYVMLFFFQQTLGVIAVRSGQYHLSDDGIIIKNDQPQRHRIGEIFARITVIHITSGVVLGSTTIFAVQERLCFNFDPTCIYRVLFSLREHIEDCWIAVGLVVEGLMGRVHCIASNGLHQRA